MKELFDRDREAFPDPAGHDRRLNRILRRTRRRVAARDLLNLGLGRFGVLALALGLLGFAVARRIRRGSPTDPHRERST